MAKGQRVLSISSPISLALTILTLFLFVSSSSSSEGVVEKRVGELEWVMEEEEGKVMMKMKMKMKRRVLMYSSSSSSSSESSTVGKRYISYDALKGDIVPCNRPGIPYYNCHALPTANPYSRGCSIITGCARGG